MFVENLDDVPESWREQFVETEIDGKKGFQDKDSNELKQHLFNVKSENKDHIAKNAELSSKFADIEAVKAADIEAAKNEALEKARSSKDVDAIEERYKQQMEDLRTRNSAEIDEYKTKLDTLNTTTKNKAIDALVAEIGGMAMDGGREAFKRLIRSQIDYNAENGEYTFLDDGGGATSLDLNGFKADIAKNSLYSSLLPAEIITKGGGNVNGSQNVGDVSGVPKTLEACKGDRALETAFFNAQLNK